MALPVWPTDLPLPDYGFGGGVKTPVNRTQMDSGLVRQTVRFPTQLKTYQASWVFTAEEFDMFKDFFTDDLGNGTGYFIIPLPDGVNDEEGNFHAHKLRFMGAEYDDRITEFETWQVRATLERLIEQTEASEPEVNPVPLWYRPELTITGNDALDLTDANALVTGAPTTGQTWSLTIPAGITVGIKNTGLGGILVYDEDGDPGGGAPPEVPISGNVTLDAGDEGNLYYGAPAAHVIWQITVPSTPMDIGVRNEGLGGIIVVRTGGDITPPVVPFLTKMVALSPWACWDVSQCQITSSSVSSILDLSGNNRTLTDSRTATSRATVASGEMVTAHTGLRTFRGILPSGTLPSKFRLFTVMRIDAAFLALANAQRNLIAAEGLANYPTAQFTIQRASSATKFQCSNSGGQEIIPAAIGMTNQFLLECSYDSVAGWFWVANGHLVPNGTGLANVGTTVTWNGIRIGWYDGSTAHNTWWKHMTVFDESTTKLTMAQLRTIRECFYAEFANTGDKLYDAY